MNYIYCYRTEYYEEDTKEHKTDSGIVIAEGFSNALEKIVEYYGNDLEKVYIEYANLDFPDTNGLISAGNLSVIVKQIGGDRDGTESRWQAEEDKAAPHGRRKAKDGRRAQKGA